MADLERFHRDVRRLCVEARSLPLEREGRSERPLGDFLAVVAEQGDRDAAAPVARALLPVLHKPLEQPILKGDAALEHEVRVLQAVAELVHEPVLATLRILEHLPLSAEATAFRERTDLDAGDRDAEAELADWIRKRGLRALGRLGRAAVAGLRVERDRGCRFGHRSPSVA